MQPLNYMIDLRQEPLAMRNKIIGIVKKSREFYNLENQVLKTSKKVMKLILEEL